MTTLASKISQLQAALDTLSRQHKVPGASLGIARGDELIELTTGVANINTGVPVTPNTLFQIGSNTKLYTGTLVMQLVDEGLIDLDAPVKKYIPDLKLGDAKALPKITVRHLLTHTSGIEGDYFDDLGRGDDGIENYVKSLKDIGNVYPPGHLWSYCNSGWVLAGHLVEVVRGKPYHAVLREKLLAPIGAPMTTVLMEEMLAHSCVVGHMLMPGMAEPVVPPMVMLSYSSAPAGSVTTSTAAEVIRFTQMHLNGGRASDGTQVLSREGVAAMQAPQFKRPAVAPGDMGLGWIMSEWDGEKVIGHGGGTIGQLSFLQVIPGQRFVVCLLTNSNTGGALFRDLGRYVFEEFAGVHVPTPPKPSTKKPKLDLKKYVGRYDRYGIDTEIKLEDGTLKAYTQAKGVLASVSAPQTYELKPVDKEMFTFNMQGETALAQFLEFDRNGRPRYCYIGSRVAKRG